MLKTPVIFLGGSDFLAKFFLEFCDVVFFFIPLHYETKACRVFATILDDLGTILIIIESFTFTLIYE